MKTFPVNISPFKDDGSMNDILTIDATAEVDEFEQFLNEFEEDALKKNKKESKECHGLSFFSPIYENNGAWLIPSILAPYLNMYYSL